MKEKKIQVFFFPKSYSVLPNKIILKTCIKQYNVFQKSFSVLPEEKIIWQPAKSLMDTVNTLKKLKVHQGVVWSAGGYGIRVANAELEEARKALVDSFCTHGCVFYLRLLKCSQLT